MLFFMGMIIKPENIFQSSIFKNLTEQEVKWIADNMAYVKYKRNESISKQNAFATHIIIIAQGYGKLYVESSDDKTMIIDILSNRSVIGLSSIFGNTMYHYSTATIDKSTVAFIDSGVIKNLILKNPKFSADIIRYFSNQEYLLYQRVNSLVQKQLHGRMADTLLYLAKEVYRSDVFLLTLSRKDLADFSAMSTESAIRILKDFKNEGIIKLDNKELKIVKLELLEKLSEHG